MRNALKLVSFQLFEEQGDFVSLFIVKPYSADKVLSFLNISYLSGNRQDYLDNHIFIFAKAIFILSHCIFPLN